MDIQRMDIENSQPISKVRKINPSDLEGYFKTNENFLNNNTIKKEQIELTKEELTQVVNKSNEYTLGLNAQFEFRIHERTGRTMVRLVNKESGEVLKEIPPQKMLEIVADIWDAIGINVDRKE